MTTESTLQSVLGALVAGKCYPVINPAPVPGQSYITFQIIAGVPIHISDGLERKRVQIDVFAASYGATKTLSESVKTAMDANFVCSMIMAMDEYEEVTKEYRQILEYYIWP